MTDEPAVQYKWSERVIHLVINRPDRRNALNDAVVAGLSAGIDEATRGDALAIVVTGAGERAFCAGGDLKRGSGMFDHDYSQPTTGYAQMLRKVMQCDIPIVARVNGACMAGGMGVLSMCDMAVAADDVIFGLPEVKIGMFPMQVASLMQHLIPQRRFREMCLTGEPISAQDAADFGLINYVVPRAQLDERLQWLVGRIIDKSPTAVRIGKHALLAITDMTFAQSIAYTEGQIQMMRLTKDAEEGLASFNDKRPPQWTGR
ncbi:enoyl-CoA hydratase/isomerase family protein [Sphingomonas sp. CL5.1]|uniref:enoyl-CoA hydratase-related protein n=1 Tax=Sphingomonas sp. CL5.1 TaxID=2653203 RepID=UPI001581D784|nr:enoyl-CoA hydratase-related protein [Sphingomonas sp. CL5.1]QKR99271.1 enoyl-CoA hydratase/isomerase family protein [Sphingomonas sp. CL5.1]